MNKMTAEGNHLILEKTDYEEEKVSTGGIIYKMKDSVDGSFCEAKIISMGQGYPNSKKVILFYMMHDPGWVCTRILTSFKENMWLQ